MRKQIRRVRATVESIESRLLFNTIYVDVNAPGPSHDGTSWATAYVDLQAALAAAPAGSGDQIHVAKGTYMPTAGTDRTISFVLKDGLSLLGGYAGCGAANPNARDISRYLTVLSGDIGVAGDASDNSYHVVVGSGTDSTAGLDGFTVTEGNADDNHLDNLLGGGLLNDSGSPTISNCTFTSNSAGDNYSGYGGAIYNFASSSAITNCAFIGNKASSWGAGIYSSDSSLTVTDCTLSGNSAHGGGGGMFNGDYSSATLTNCTFIRNSGGGMLNYSNSSATLTNCVFSGNSGGIANESSCSPMLINCIFVGNAGGGMSNDNASNPTLINCVFADNSAKYYGAAILDADSSPTLINCIIWGNTAATGNQIYEEPGGASITYSDIQGGWSGTGNIDADPLFFRNPNPGPDKVWGTADDDYGDLRISAASPAVDAGDNAAIPVAITTDLGGRPRFQDVPTTADTGVGMAPIVDIGAYEATAALAASSGGPYAVLAGQCLTLSGRGASSVGTSLKYDWRWSGGGRFHQASGPNVVFPVGQYAPGTIITVRLRVTDQAGHKAFSSTTVRIEPVMVYVDASAPKSGADNGTSWRDAFKSLAIALDLALPGQTIRVADGTYKPTSTTDRTASFMLEDGVAIDGGYAGYGAKNPDARDVQVCPTILSGDIGTVGDNSDNSYHVVSGIGTDSTAVLDGFTVTAGNASGTDPDGEYGGGMYNVLASPTIANCTFRNNSASSGGGAIYNDSSSPTITLCSFNGNSTSGYEYNGGGAIFNIGFNGKLSPTISQCIFSDNSGTFGGAIENASSSEPAITDCIFKTNLGTAGGAVYDGQYYTDTVITNCVFVGNGAAQGGAVYIYAFTLPTCINCTFSGNIASDAGGAVYANQYSTPTLSNSILWGNTAPIGAQIYWAGSGRPHITVTHNDIQGGWSGAGNINADPQFVRNPSPGADNTWGTADDDYGDLRLRATSPCIDAGDNSAVPVTVTTDLAGNPRIIDTPAVNDPGAIVDMGAYEYQSPLTASGGTYLCSVSRPAVQISFNGDVNSGTIDPGDLILYNQTTGQTIDTQNLATVNYDPNTRVATWSFNTSLLPDGNYHATLGSGTCSDTLGNPLADAYEFDFSVLAGDANHDGVVNVADLSIVAVNWQGNAKVFSQGDFNYDGKVDLADLQILAGNWNKTLSGAGLGPMIPMPSILPLSPPVPPPPVAATVTTAIKRTATKLVTQVVS